MGHGTGKNPPQGRIARLPDSLRRELNAKILDGESSRSILDWLNVQVELQGKPKINTGILRDYRRGEYARWLSRNPIPRCVVLVRHLINSRSA